MPKKKIGKWVYVQLMLLIIDLYLHISILVFPISTSEIFIIFSHNNNKTDLEVQFLCFYVNCFRMLYYSYKLYLYILWNEHVEYINYRNPHYFASLWNFIKFFQYLDTKKSKTSKLFENLLFTNHHEINSNNEDQCLFMLAYINFIEKIQTIITLSVFLTQKHRPHPNWVRRTVNPRPKMGVDTIPITPTQLTSGPNMSRLTRYEQDIIYCMMQYIKILFS